MDRLLPLVDELVGYLSPGQLLSFRSTLYPGTTRIVQDRIEDAGFEIGEEIYLSFAPERIAQHRAFQEVVSLPQLIGAFDNESYERTKDLFDTFLESNCYRLNPTEAELGKLFTNMWRYLTFAAANEFFLITESFAKHHEVNVHRILEQTSRNYPRFDIPSPGTNVGGPCLTKDGWFLVDNIPYNELVTASYRINEGMPGQVIDKMATLAPDPETVTILGMTYKRNSDDIRNSVSFAMRKQLRRKGYDDVVEVDPNLDQFADMTYAVDTDWLILMTPHKEFDDLLDVTDAISNPDCLYCDIWGHWDEMKFDSRNGFFFGSEINASSTIEERERV
jgi:UDP-N-acetyl-D-mannosaminuronic acid dehydrogenase